MTRQPPVANEVQQRAAIESDVCQLAVVEFHQPVEVTPNDASVRDLLEQSLGGNDHDRPQRGAANADALCAGWQE